MKNWLDEVVEWVTAICDASLEEPAHGIATAPNDGSWALQGDMAAYLGAAHVYLARWTGDESHMERAKEYVLCEVPMQAFGACAGYFGTKAVIDANMLTAEEEETVRRRMTGIVGWGHFDWLVGFRHTNHACTQASMCDAIARLWPDARESRELRAISEQIWREWWSLGENIETAPNYEGFHQNHMLMWADRRGEREKMLTHPGTQSWMNRAVEHMLPCGYLPAYGDSNNTEYWCDWFSLFAHIAAWTGNARARWNAERMFDWFRERDFLRNLDILDSAGDNVLRRRMAWWHVTRWAWYLAVGRDRLVTDGASVGSQPPPVRPVVTHRTMPDHDLIRDSAWSTLDALPGQRIPDKTILRNGTGPESVAVAFCNGRQSWHDHIDMGAISAFIANGTVLLDDSGYMLKLPVDHNMFLAQPADEEWMAYSPDEWSKRRAQAGSFGRFDFQVRGLTGERAAQSTAAECHSPYDMRFHQTRSLLLGRSGVLMVHDAVTPYRDGLVGSPTWHVQDVHKTGPGLAVTSLDRLCGLGGQWVENGPEQLVIVDPMASEAWECEPQRRPNVEPGYATTDPYKSWEPFVYRAYVTRNCLFRRREMTAEKTEHFFTVLMPLSVAGEAKNAVRVLDRFNGTSMALEAAGALIVVNEGEDVVSGSWGSTDAREFWWDGGAVFAHRVKKIAVDAFSLECDDYWLDVDLLVEGGSLIGKIASHRYTDVRLATPEGERTLRVGGITELNLKL